MSLSKFTLRRYDGSPVSYHLVDTRSLPPVTVEATVAHLALVIDASGSMYGDMAAMRTMTEKLLTIEEFRGAEVLVSLCSYASSGDLQVNFERTPVAEVMKPGSAHIEALRTMRTRGMTCISQALAYAGTLCRPGETTCIALQSDGYCNDRSPTEEKKALTRILADLQRKPDLMVSTIAYRSSSDFVLLDGIAAAMGGRCVQAETSAQVYEVLHDTAKLVAGRGAPAIVLDADGADAQVAISLTQRKVNGTTKDLTLRGVQPGDDVLVFRYRTVRKEVYDTDEAIDLSRIDQTRSDPTAMSLSLIPLYAFARAALADGRVNTAKYALVASRDDELLRRHAARPPATPCLAALAAALDEVLYTPGATRSYRAEPKMDTSKLSLVEVLDLLTREKEHISVDLPAMLSGYHRRGLKYLAASRDENGVLVSNPTRLVPTDNPRTVPIGGFETNLKEATIQLNVCRPAVLVDTWTDASMNIVAGERLSLFDIRSYTIVADGVVTLQDLPIRIGRKVVHDVLVQGGVLPQAPYDFEATYPLPIADLPVLPWVSELPLPVGAFKRLAELRCLLSMLNACLPGSKKGLVYTEEQRAAFAAKGLSSPTSVSMARTVPYDDRDIAIAQGEIDSYTRYAIELMSPTIPGLEAFWSGNEYLARRLKVFVLDSGTRKVQKDGALDKPTWPDVFTDGVRLELKPTSARTTYGAEDALQCPILAELTGMSKAFGTPLVLKDILRDTPVEPNILSGLWQIMTMHAVRRQEVLAKAIEGVKAALDTLYDAYVRPLALSIGCSGLVPDDWKAVPLEGDAVEAKYGFKLADKQRDNGTFYCVPAPVGQFEDVIVAVYATTAWYSTERGVQAAKAQQKAVDAKGEVEE